MDELELHDAIYTLIGETYIQGFQPTPNWEIQNLEIANVMTYEVSTILATYALLKAGIKDSLHSEYGFYYSVRNILWVAHTGGGAAKRTAAKIASLLNEPVPEED